LAILGLAFALVALWRVVFVYDAPAWQAAIPIAVISCPALVLAAVFWRSGREADQEEAR